MSPPSIYPTGVTRYHPDQTYNSYVLFDGRDTRSYLIDMNGNEVHIWNYSGFPVEMVDPNINGGKRGHVLVQKEADIFANQTLLELNWEGEVVWFWGDQTPTGKAGQNHDLARLPDGNTLLLSRIEHVVPGLSEQPIRDQIIYEVTPDGQVVWQWKAGEHLDELGFSIAAQALMVSPHMRARSSLLVLNNMSPLGPNRWHEAGDERFHPDNIMIDSREGNVIAIIEKATGRIVWRMGPVYPGTFDFSKRPASRAVPRPVDRISGQHDAHMIPPGLPGAGNILVFDNQGSAGFPPAYLELFPGSRILEINPISQDIVWQYDASFSGKPLWTFYSSFISSARRLPNGNTLICEGMYGRLFQVTPVGEIVWEYINPHFGEWTDHDTDSGGRLANWIFRAQPIPYDWVPEDTPCSENPVIPPKLADFHV